MGGLIEEEEENGDADGDRGRYFQSEGGWSRRDAGNARDIDHWGIAVVMKIYGRKDDWCW